MKRIYPIIISMALVASIAGYIFWPVEIIEYNTQVKPIFNKKCIACHGGVKQKAGFSLLFREEALGVLALMVLGFVTIGSQTYKTALSNPAETLKSGIG